MIEIVLMFGLINVIFEFVLLSMVSPKHRLRLLGNRHSQMLLHMAFLIVNLWVHWGTVTGTMSSIVAFICSMITVQIAQILYGKIVDGRHYTTGLIRYSKGELT